MTDEGKTGQHYERSDLVERLKTVLAEAGFAEKAPRTHDLAALDQFHSRGIEATVELAKELQLSAATRILDIGSGLGGPSRYLASTFGCTVHGIDLSQSFVDAANFLAERTGLEDRVIYQRANALSLPFQNNSFDVAWTQHVAMNIADRPALYREAFRVLKPGGRLAIYDVVAASGAPLHYPVPWAPTPDTSFLITGEAMRDVLLQQGFRIPSWTDSTAAGIKWFEERQRGQAPQTTAPALSLLAVMGPAFREMSGNLLRNFREGRAALIQAIAEKP